MPENLFGMVQGFLKPVFLSDFDPLHLLTLKTIVLSLSGRRRETMQSENGNYAEL